jgi:hypothetical protein
MSDTGTTKLIKLYEQRSARPRFFSSRFASPPENFHNTDKVEIDVVRQGQHIAIPVRDMKSGPRKMSMDNYVNKAFVPTVFNYDVSLAAADLATREPGVDPYTDPVWATAATRRIFAAMRKLEDMIRDGIEVMAAQVMQSGVLTLVDESNNTIFSLDFQPLDATGTLASGDLMVTTGTEWAADGASGTPLTDLGTLIANMAAHGYDATDAVFGSTAIQRFLANAEVKTQLNLLRLNVGEIMMRGQGPGGGASRIGDMVIGGRLIRLWTYSATYLHPYTAAITPYLHAEKVVVWDETAPRDLTWGGIPLLPATSGQQQLSFIPPRLSMPERGLDLQQVAYVTQDRKNLVVNVGCRPLTIPTAIDGFACIDITP